MPISEVLRDKLLFPRGVLILLKETELFGPMLDQAIEDIDAAMSLLDEVEA